MGLDVVVVGSCNVDFTAYVERMPRPGETILGRSFQQGARRPPPPCLSPKLARTGTPRP